jgi:hypothetical protein
MPRGPVPFRQSDLTRCFRAARMAGVAIDRVEIDRNGHIVVIVANESERPVVTAVAERRE